MRHKIYGRFFIAGLLLTALLGRRDKKAMGFMDRLIFCGDKTLRRMGNDGQRAGRTHRLLRGSGEGRGGMGRRRWVSAG